MSEPATIIMRRKRWRVRWSRLKDCEGTCDKPDEPGKAITLHPGLRRNDRKLLEILLHELLHAAAWDLDEELVSEYAHDAARALQQFGFFRRG